MSGLYSVEAMPNYREIETGEILACPVKISSVALNRLRKPVREALRGGRVPLPETARVTLVARKLDSDGAVIFSLELLALGGTIKCGVAWTEDGVRAVLSELGRSDSGTHALPFSFVHPDVVAANTQDANQVIEYVNDVVATILLHTREEHEEAGLSPPPAAVCVDVD